MKKQIALTMLSALLLTACMPEGEDLQGRFEPAIEPPTLNAPWSMELSISSPSGDRTAAVSDELLIFDIELPASDDLESGAQFLVSFESEGDLDIISHGDIINLKTGSTTIGTGVFLLVDPGTPNEGTALITTTKTVKSKINTLETFTISVDTKRMLAEDPGEEDPLTVSVEYNGKIVTGNELSY